MSFSYGTHIALEHVNIDVHAGEIVGILGHNGAGKSTTIRLLNGLLVPQSGTIEVFGTDPLQGGAELRSKTSVLTDALGLYERQTPRETLRFHAQLWGIAAREVDSFGVELLVKFGLGEVIDVPVKTFSRGMRQRLALARSLLHRPAFLLLDEPTLGMDPVGRKHFRDVLAELRSQGVAVLMSTHDLGEVERACQRVVILHQGRVLLDGTPEECMRPLMKNLAVEVTCDEAVSKQSVDGLHRMEGLSEVVCTGAHVSFVAVDQRATANAVRVLVETGAGVVAIGSSAPTLEDVYLRMHDDGAGK